MLRPVAILFLLALGGPFPSAGATERGDWFKGLLQPQSGKPCCDIADCFKTDADWKDGGWWAEMRGHWVPVPPSRIVRNATSIDGAAYVCSAIMPMGFGRPLPADVAVEILRDGIFCFVPPDLGS